MSFVCLVRISTSVEINFGAFLCFQKLFSFFCLGISDYCSVFFFLFKTIPGFLFTHVKIVTFLPRNGLEAASLLCSAFDISGEQGWRVLFRLLLLQGVSMVACFLPSQEILRFSFGPSLLFMSVSLFLELI